MIRLLLLLGVVWLALMPPLFTGGECTAEFDRATAQVEKDRKALATPQSAAAYWREQRVPYSALELAQCRRSKPRSISHCGNGPLVYAEVPVKNPICKVYRDDAVRVHLYYDDRGRLARVESLMSPYRSLPIAGYTLHWAR